MLNDHAATSTTMWHETPQLILICEFPKFTALPEKVAIINLLPANVWNLLTDLGFDANLMPVRVILMQFWIVLRIW